MIPRLELKVAGSDDEDTTEADEKDDWEKLQINEYNRLNEAHFSSRKAAAYPKKNGQLQVAEENDEDAESDLCRNYCGMCQFFFLFIQSI
jgi:hypothetical protein